MVYDEEAELTSYVWSHFEQLMTDFERRVGRAATAREKAGGSQGEAMRRMLSERWGLIGDPDVDEALADGSEAFRRSVCRRVLAERGDSIVNRCPRCRRVVRTPKAQQCFWCGNHWHGPSP
jgi:hypothetical protein